MGVKRSLQRGGILLSLVANVLMVLSTATNYWTRQQEGHSGLWQECNHGICSNIPCQTTLAVTAACMVLAVGVGVVGMVMGLRIRCNEGESLRGQTTSAFLFLGGETAAPAARAGRRGGPGVMEGPGHQGRGLRYSSGIRGTGLEEAERGGRGSQSGRCRKGPGPEAGREPIGVV
ncbi:PREDICTED: claudin domain-containing protein 2 isoform X4 [Rhinopithecus bieti]|uniref:claudin domain-containing protein 2 isoform X4 n=1 Tax=Rhinopithecus bieti TaxID=61621 RepID=UPI00083BCB62|nr:PREDICTED: claudin domain-containing protein 2 isoform X4 [Rhinopithecus bieti]XP_017731943.1 PREDICTED: claudin domain-containing protein 2 isoform X4 [Rhinopithecus bieti]